MWFTILAESRKHNVVIAAVCFFVSKIVGTTNNWAGANLTEADSQRRMQMMSALNRRDGSWDSRGRLAFACILEDVGFPA